MQKIAIFGGAFNPVHWGHLRVAEAALHQTSLNCVLWVPSAQPPHKGQYNILPFHHRLTMVQLAIARYPHFAVSPIEQEFVQDRNHRSGQPVFAVETLRALQTLYPAAQWYWLLGLDTFLTLPRWYDNAELAQTCDWLVAPRVVDSAATDPVTAAQQAGEAVAEWFRQQAIPLQWQVLPMQVVHLSASQVRQTCRERKSLQNLVPDAVQTYLLTHHLYE